MGMNFDDEQLMTSLLKFVTGTPVQIQLVDLYGNKKPSQLFDTTTTTTIDYHVFTQLKKKKGNGKNFNRGIVGGGGGSWKGVDNSRPVYDKKRSLIGFKKTFRFHEKNHVWIMKEYRLSDNILKSLRQRGHDIRHEEEFVICRITRSVNSSQVIIPWKHNVENFLRNQDFGQSNAANVIPSDELNSILNGNISQVSLLPKESNVPAAIYEECSVPVVHQETPSVSFVAKESNVAAAKEEECSVRPDYDIATYHKELDAYAASILEKMVPYIPESQEDEDEIPLFCEDFYIGHTNLWS